MWWNKFIEFDGIFWNIHFIYVYADRKKKKSDTNYTTRL